jgi:hypothetical protein
MRSKTCTLHAISLCLFPLLTAGCLSDNLLSDHPGTSNKPMEIRMKSSIAGAMSDTRGGGMINAKTAFSVDFARVDEGASSYPNVYLTPAIPGGVSTTNVLTFTPPAYYQADKAKKTKLIGWYPTGATYASSAESSTVLFSALDGETDIMVTALKEGSQNNQFSGITFTHLLTQISVKVYATSDATKTLWGGVKSITIADKKQTCTLTLPATSANVDATATAAFDGTDDLPLVKKDPSGNADITYSGDVLSLGVKSGNTTNAVLAGYAMFAPVAGNTDLALTVETEKGVAEATATREDGFVAGQSYVITLKFDASGIAPAETVITDWKTPIEVPEITV